MDVKFYVALVAIFIQADRICSLHSNDHQDILQVSPSDFISVNIGDNVQVNCSSAHAIQGKFPQWERSRSASGNIALRQKPVNNRTMSLFIMKAQPRDSGKYLCVLGSISKLLEVHVVAIPHITPALSQGCTGMFTCENSYKIFCRYHCNGREDCPDGSDEWNCNVDPCLHKFRCNNSACVETFRVCDDHNDCSDWSDEDSCPRLPDYPASVTPESPDPSTDGQMTWLKTTVYTVIACTVGVVLFISIIVIAVFRLKMKRAAIRRATRQAERRRRHLEQQSGDGHGEVPNLQGEVEPFISSPSHSHFGNVIVNVNNGVQFVRNPEFPSLIQSPPSYSEVLAESENLRPGRHSPPPEYSTIDRNPNRGSLSPTDNFPPLISGENVVGNTSATSATNVSNSARDQGQGQRQDTNSGCEAVSSIVNSSGVPGARSANVAQTSDSGPSDRNCASDLGQSSTQVSDSRSGRSSPWRPKQLQVREGQIVLDGNDSPETTNQITQTNPADISVGSVNQQGGKPAQIQVQGGQIVLANQAGGSSVSAEQSGIECSGVAQGQLDVKDGQIVFKSS